MHPWGSLFILKCLNVAKWLWIKTQRRCFNWEVSSLTARNRKLLSRLRVLHVMFLWPVRLMVGSDICFGFPRRVQPLLSPFRNRRCELWPSEVISQPNSKELDAFRSRHSTVADAVCSGHDLRKSVVDRVIGSATDLTAWAKYNQTVFIWCGNVAQQ